MTLKRAARIFVQLNFMRLYLPAIVFFISFFLQTFSANFVFINFYTNQKYIAANLCINKFKPETKCCGKCQLVKKLKQQDQDTQNTGKKSENKEEVVLAEPEFYNIEISASTIKNFWPFYKEDFFSPISYTFFHPPRYNYCVS